MQDTDSGIIDLSVDDDLLDLYDEYEIPERPVSIPDAFIQCRKDTGRVDMRRIAEMSGRTVAEVAEALRGSIFRNPVRWDGTDDSGWETADEYLSGNLRQKLETARQADRAHEGVFAGNIEALEALLPPEVRAEDIYVAPGSPWLPTKIIDDFINHLIQPHEYHRYSGTLHDEETGSWALPGKSDYSWYVRNNSTFGTERMNALDILEDTLNMKTVRVKDKVRSDRTRSGYATETNRDETAAAIEKQKLIVAEFRQWIWQDEARKKELKRLFEQKYACTAARKFDGGFLEFPGMAAGTVIYPYQKDAVARIIFSPNTLLAHDVGAGKTYIMIAAAMELRRMGMAERCMFVVPNSLVGQWRRTFLTLYPNADLLCIEPGDMVNGRYDRTMQSIIEETYDGIIIAGSCFDRIPLSRQAHIEALRTKRDEMMTIMERRRNVTPAFKRKLEKLNKDLSALAAKKDAAKDIICFDQLGIDRLFVDEAHTYKNISIETSIYGVYGISRKGSAKCDSMMGKVHHVQKMNNGGGVVMATGTPITNSVSDIYVFQKYLQSGELRLIDLQTFDSWAGMFAEQTTSFEISVDTGRYRLATRFARFHNLPELAAILSSIADFHSIDSSEGLPVFDGYTDVLIPKSADLKAYLEEISERADRVYQHKVSPDEDNMLKITVDGRKAALDLRLLTRNAGDGIGTAYGQPVGICKVSECAERAAGLWHKTKADRLTQIIFCDTSTPKAGFNIYDELKHRLVGLGVDATEIAYIHDADGETSRERLFEDMREGRIRILIGSTSRLGLGVNVQDRLTAVHHLDLPWRPADMVQREGRILRAGNLCDKVDIYRYTTEGSFDAYSWQLLETKQRFISDILSGTAAGRSGSEVDGTVLDYAEIKALALDDPLLKLRVETQNELSRLVILQKKAVESRLRLDRRRGELPDLISAKQLEIDACLSDTHADGLRRQKELLEQELRDTEDEIGKMVNYADLINEYTVRLDQIDEELGVNELRRKNMQ